MLLSTNTLHVSLYLHLLRILLFPQIVHPAARLPVLSALGYLSICARRLQSRLVLFAFVKQLQVRPKAAMERGDHTDTDWRCSFDPIFWCLLSLYLVFNFPVIVPSCSVLLSFFATKILDLTMTTGRRIVITGIDNLCPRISGVTATCLLAFLVLAPQYVSPFAPAGLRPQQLPRLTLRIDHAKNKLSLQPAGRWPSQQQLYESTSCLYSSTSDESLQRSLLETRLEIERKSKQTQSLLQHLRTIVSASLVGARFAISTSWWCFPFMITVYPLFHFLASGKPATSPSFWSMPVLSSLIHSPSAGVVIGGFLLSNISYFLSGLYLLNVIPRLDVRLEAPSKRKLTVKTEPGPGFSDNPLLGIMVILCGVCSVFYHTFQTIGPQYHAVAETFFFIDHGFAISTILYFLSLFGVPSRKTMAIGTAGLLMLAAGGLRGAEAYAWIHSLWHFFSAGASVSWAHDGLKRSGEDESSS